MAQVFQRVKFQLRVRVRTSSNDKVKGQSSVQDKIDERNEQSGTRKGKGGGGRTCFTRSLTIAFQTLSLSLADTLPTVPDCAARPTRSGAKRTLRRASLSLTVLESDESCLRM